LIKTTVVMALMLRLFCGNSSYSSLHWNYRKCESFLVPKVGCVFPSGEHVKGAEFFKIPVLYYFFQCRGK